MAVITDIAWNTNCKMKLKTNNPVPYPVTLPIPVSFFIQFAEFCDITVIGSRNNGILFVQGLNNILNIIWHTNGQAVPLSYFNAPDGATYTVNGAPAAGPITNVVLLTDG